MKDKKIINVPVYRTRPIEMDNNLFPPTNYSMINDVVQKVSSFCCSSTKTIIVERTGKNYTLEVVKIKASNVTWRKSSMVLFQMTVQKKDFGEEYVETTPSTVLPMSESVKMGSRTYFFIMYPVISSVCQGRKIKTFWNVFVYDDPNKDSEDFLKVVKMVLKVILNESIRNIKYKDFLREIRNYKVLDKISVSVLTIDDIDENYRATYKEWIVKSSLKKKKTVEFEKLPSDRFQELYECQDVDEGKIHKKVFQVFSGQKQFTLSRERKLDVGKLNDTFITTVESCFNDTISIGDGEDGKIFEVEFILNNVGPIIHKYMS